VVGVLVAAMAIAFGPLAPGDGLGLAPGPREAAPFAPAPAPPRLPVLPGLGGVGIAAAAGGALRRRRGAQDDPLYVFVPGHGGTAEDFDDLVIRLGLTPGQVEAFDYRWVWPDRDPRTAARWAPTAEAAGALHAYLAALSATHRRIYLVGHSKGGAVITEMVARWDREPAIGVDEVYGAALLDPAIAAGSLGELQQLGYLIGEVADNGLFHPERCSFLRCWDVRDHLGEASGVEVIAVRNPHGLVTSFRDHPEGLRVFDLDDGGEHPFARPWNVAEVYQRIGVAHGSVLHNDRVAECITAESVQLGSCRWPAPPRPMILWGRGALPARHIVV